MTASKPSKRALPLQFWSKTGAVTLLLAGILASPLTSSCKLRPAQLSSTGDRASEEQAQTFCTANLRFELSSDSAQSERKWFTPFKNQKKKEQKERLEALGEQAALLTAATAVKLGALQLLNRLPPPSQGESTFDVLMRSLKSRAQACYVGLSCEQSDEECRVRYPHVDLAGQTLRSFEQDLSLLADTLRPLANAESGQQCSTQADVELRDLFRDLNGVCEMFLKSSERKERQALQLEIEDLALAPIFMNSAQAAFGSSRTFQEGMCALEMQEEMVADQRKDNDLKRGTLGVGASIAGSVALMLSPFQPGLLFDDFVSVGLFLAPSIYQLLHSYEEEGAIDALTGEGEQCTSSSIVATREYREQLIFKDLVGLAVGVSLTGLVVQVGPAFAQLMKANKVWVANQQLLFKLDALPFSQKIVGLLEEGFNKAGLLVQADTALVQSARSATEKPLEEGAKLIKVPLFSAEQFQKVVNKVVSKIPGGDRLIPSLTKQYDELLQGALAKATDKSVLEILEENSKKSTNQRLREAFVGAVKTKVVREHGQALSRMLTARALTSLSRRTEGKISPQLAKQIVNNPKFAAAVNAGDAQAIVELIADLAGYTVRQAGSSLKKELSGGELLKHSTQLAGTATKRMDWQNIDYISILQELEGTSTFETFLEAFAKEQAAETQVIDEALFQMWSRNYEYRHGRQSPALQILRK